MKRLTKTFSVLLILFAMLTFSACKDKDFSVYLFTSNGGTISINDSDEHIELKETVRFSKKGSITLHAHAKEGYTFLYWLVNSYFYSVDTTLDLDVKGETVIKAMFKNNLEGEYQITFLDVDGKEISTSPINYNDYITLPTVNVPDGYTAVFFDTENETDTLSSGRKFNYGTNKVFKLKYIPIESEPVKYKVSTITNDNCTFELVSGYSWEVQEGGNIQVKITAKSGYKIVSVKANSNVITDDNNDNIYEISNISYDIEISATVELISTPTPTPIYYTITPVVNEGYSFELLPGYLWTVLSGFSTKFKINVLDGYTLISVYTTNETLTATNGVYEISNVTSNLNLYANVNKNQPSNPTTPPVDNSKYHVTIPTSDKYDIVLEDGYSFDNIQENEEVKFKIVVKTGYVVKSVVANTTILTDINGIYTISDITENYNLSVVVEQVSNYIVFNNPGKLTIKDENNNSIYSERLAVNGEFKFSISGYDKNHDNLIVKVNGTSVSASNGFYKITVSGETNVEIVYEQAVEIDYGTISGQDFTNVLTNENDILILDDYLYINYNEEILSFASFTNVLEFVSTLNTMDKNTSKNYRISQIITENGNVEIPYSSGLTFTSEDFASDLYNKLLNSNRITIEWEVVEN